MHLMTLRTKIILLTIVIITALATIFAATYKPKRTETITRPVIKIGVYLPLSEPNSHLGLAAQKAIDQTIKEASFQTRYKYEAVYNDYYLSSTNISDAKAIVFYSISPEPQVTLSFGADNPSRFIIHSPYKNVVDLFVKDISSRNFKKIGLITEASGQYRLLAKTFKEALPETYELNGAVFQSGQKDFNIIINLLRNNDTDLFVLVGAPTEVDVLISQLQDNGVSNFNISTLYSIDLSNQPQLYENTRSVGSLAGTFDASLASKAVKTVIEAYEKNFKKDLLPNSSVISDYIAKNHTQDNIIPINAAIKIVQDGKVIPLKE